jgi:hypothetical protein
MGNHRSLPTTAIPLIRPKLLIETAHIGARLYHRGRDLAGAISCERLRSKSETSGPAQAQIVARLSEAERHCEALRRERSPAYRSGKHVQILSALFAEADLAVKAADQTKASGSDALRLAT